jgi:hypothetical protein
MPSKFDARGVCRRLLDAESEAQVKAIIDDTPEMADPSNWRPLDRRETNFNITSNQASDGGKALTELMTNMVDAVLMKHAYQKGIDPKGPEAPRTMYEAVDKLIKNLRGGKLVNLDPDDPWLRDFAQKNLVVGITGAKTKSEGLPCYSFVDNGEGQQPEDYEDTFLSLSAGTKKSIPFVQGKYNMGSSGVLRYCGRRWFKLIVSRRYDGNSDWGWTLVRRRPDDGDSMPIAEYFVRSDGGVPSFTTDILYPFTTATGRRYDGVALKTGTIVKLYDYQVGSKFLTFRGARETLNENLVETILPFRLLDFRQLPRSREALEKAKKRGGERAEGIDPRPFYGMEFLLRRSHREDGREDEEEDAAGGEPIFVGEFTEPDLGRVTITAIPLKREIPGWLKYPSSNNRVFHAVNGQVQFKQSRGYLSQTCGFPALKDRVVIIVDASHLTFGAHNEVWKGDREHISNTIVGERYVEQVTTTVKSSEALAKLQLKIAEDELKRATTAESNALFQKLVDADRNLAGLLSNRHPSIRLPASGGTDGSEAGGGEFEGHYSPTFIRLEGRYRENGLDIPIDKTRPVAARTDAGNGYLNRPDNRGAVLMDEMLKARFGIRHHLHNGRLVVYFEPLVGKVKVGETFRMTLGLKDEAMSEAVHTELFTICIGEEQEASEKRRRAKAESKAGEGDREPGRGNNAPTHGLPKCVLLTNDGREIPGYGSERWPDGFGEGDGGLIADLDDNEVIYKINFENAYHIKYREQQRGQVAKDVVTEKYILGMRILMLGYEHAVRTIKTGNDGSENGIAEFQDQFRRMAARGAASTVLALAENLPKIVDKSSVVGALDVE